MALSDCDDSAYVGRDGPKDSIAVAIARPGRSGPEWPGTIPNRRSALRRRIAAGRCRWSAAPAFSRAPRVATRIRLRGIPVRSAVTILAERGASTRFDTPRPRMRGLGRVPSERSSGPQPAPVGSPRPAPVLSGPSGGGGVDRARVGVLGAIVGAVKARPQARRARA